MNSNAFCKQEMQSTVTETNAYVRNVFSLIQELVTQFNMQKRRRSWSFTKQPEYSNYMMSATNIFSQFGVSFIHIDTMKKVFAENIFY